MNRREFNTGLAATATNALVVRARAAPRRQRTILYSSVGSKISSFEVDVIAGTLTRGDTRILPSAVQYAWPHPTNRFLYACTSDGTPDPLGPIGHIHRLCALRIGSDGALLPHGDPVFLDSLPIHNSVDASGGFALTAYISPAFATVHRIRPDGTLGGLVEQPSGLDFGLHPHQIRTTPSNRAVALVTRGNDATSDRPEDPGAIKLFHFREGQMSPMQDFIVGGRGGLGYGPRHLDFHPSRPWVYVALERENQLHMHEMIGDRFAEQPSFVSPTVSRNAGKPHQTLAGAIHVHPAGHVVYVSNRANKTSEVNGRRVFAGGVNSIAVFAIAPDTGAPTLVQEIDPQAFYVRTFTIDSSGTLLIAGCSVAMNVGRAEHVQKVPAALSLFRIAPDGRLTFLRKYDVALAPEEQQLWVRMLKLPD